MVCRACSRLLSLCDLHQNPIVESSRRNRITPSHKGREEKKLPSAILNCRVLSPRGAGGVVAYRSVALSSPRRRLVKEQCERPTERTRVPYHLEPRAWGPRGDLCPSIIRD